MKYERADEVYNRAFPELIFSDETVSRMHAVLADVLKDVDRSCRKRGIKYMLSGGTCLGAVRHKGFIPWDDDVDLMAYASELQAIKDALASDYPNKYEILLPYENGPVRFMKIYLNGTVLTELRSQNMPVPHKIFVDVFPIVYLPDSSKKREKLDRKHYISGRMLSVGYDSKYPSEAILSAMEKNPELKDYYSFRLKIGRIARLTGLNRWKNKTRKLELGEARKTQTEGIPSGISYNREVFEAGFFEETEDAEFEGLKLPVPKRYDDYLKNLYGDYMQLPPPEKRRRHIALEVDFGPYGEGDGK